MKPALEVSSNKRVIQTAIIADPVLRAFAQADGSEVEREVPGSFYEFITRLRDPVAVPSGTVPLADVIRFLLDRAPEGIIEWVDRGDPMVKQMLRLHQQILV